MQLSLVHNGSKLKLIPYIRFKRKQKTQVAYQGYETRRAMCKKLDQWLAVGVVGSAATGLAISQTLTT